jgi:hypothetical protein
VLCQLESEGPFRAEVLRWMPGYLDTGETDGLAETGGPDGPVEDTGGPEGLVPDALTPGR